MKYRVQAALRFMGCTLEKYTDVIDAESPSEASDAFTAKYRGKTAKESHISPEFSGMNLSGLSSSAKIMRVDIKDVVESVNITCKMSTKAICTECAHRQTDRPVCFDVNAKDDEVVSAVQSGEEAYAMHEAPEDPTNDAPKETRRSPGGYHPMEAVDEGIDLEKLWETAPKTPMTADDSRTAERLLREQMKKFGAEAVLKRRSSKEDDPFVKVGPVGSTRPNQRPNEFDNGFHSLLNQIHRTILD